MRVAMVVDRFPHETFLAQHVDALIGRGVDVQILCQEFVPDAPAAQLLEGVDLAARVHPWADRHEPTKRVRAVASAVWGATRRSPVALARASVRERGDIGRNLFAARVVALDADVLHFQFGDLAARRVHAAHSIDAAFTTSFRGYDLAYAGLDDPNFYRSLWPVLDGAHTLGDDLVARARERGCPPDIEWDIIPPGVDLDRFHPTTPTSPESDARRGSDEPIRLLCVGRLHWKKGHVDAIQAVRHLADANVPVVLRLAGEGAEREPLQWLAADLGVAERVEFVGNATPAQVVEHLAWADIVVHPSWSEGFGNAVLEAQAAGVPVVCSDAEGLPANIEPDRSGLVVPRRQPRQLAEAIARLAQDPERRAELGRAGRQRAVDHFGLDRQTESFIEFFERAIRRRAESRS